MTSREERNGERRLGLPEATALPPDLENQVLGRLRERGLIGPTSRRVAFDPTWRPAAIAAALAVTFLIGVGVGRRSTDVAPSVRFDRPTSTESDGRSPASASGAGGGVVDSGRPDRVTRFSEEVADPFLHFSEATEHPDDPRVVVKTWEY